MAITGEDDVDFDDCGIAFDADGNMYFAEEASDSVLKYSADGVLSILTTDSQMEGLVGGGAEPQGLAFSDDGFLYVIESATDQVLRINPATGVPSIYVTDGMIDALIDDTLSGDEVVLLSSIVAAPGGVLWIANNDFSGSERIK